jgi:hypothetical protein
MCTTFHLITAQKCAFVFRVPGNEVDTDEPIKKPSREAEATRLGKFGMLQDDVNDTRCCAQ